MVPLTIPKTLAISVDAEALLDHADDRDHAGDRRLEAQLDAGLAGDREELVAVLGEQLLVGGDDRLARPAARRARSRAPGSVPPISSTIRSEPLEDLAEVALASG